MAKSIKDLLCGTILKEVKGDFYCSENKLTSLEGCPEKVGRDFYCSGNPGRFTKEDVKSL